MLQLRYQAWPTHHQLGNVRLLRCKVLQELADRFILKHIRIFIEPPHFGTIFAKLRSEFFAVLFARSFKPVRAYRVNKFPVKLAVLAPQDMPKLMKRDGCELLVIHPLAKIDRSPTVADDCHAIKLPAFVIDVHNIRRKVFHPPLNGLLALAGSSHARDFAAHRLGDASNVRVYGIGAHRSAGAALLLALSSLFNACGKSGFAFAHFLPASPYLFGCFLCFYPALLFCLPIAYRDRLILFSS